MTLPGSLTFLGVRKLRCNPPSLLLSDHDGAPSFLDISLDSSLSPSKDFSFNGIAFGANVIIPSYEYKPEVFNE